MHDGLLWWLSSDTSTGQGRRCRFDPWVGKIPWRRKWQPTPVFLPGKSHGQRSLEGYSPRGGKRVRHGFQLNDNNVACDTEEDQYLIINEYIHALESTLQKPWCWLSYPPLPVSVETPHLAAFCTDQSLPSLPPWLGVVAWLFLKINRGTEGVIFLFNTSGIFNLTFKNVDVVLHFL